jgi:hypothetical protein
MTMRAVSGCVSHGFQRATSASGWDWSVGEASVSPLGHRSNVALTLDKMGLTEMGIQPYSISCRMARVLP